MRFIVYSEIEESSITKGLGEWRYGGHFICKRFCAILKSFGEVVFVREPAVEVDALYSEYRHGGGSCVFLSFTLPQNTLTTLACPTICVFAWDLSTIPDEIWDDNPHNDWRFIFQKIAGAITLSAFAEQVVKRCIGNDFQVATIPVPLAPLFAASRVACNPPIATRALQMGCTVLDSHFYRVTPDSFDAYIPAEYFRLLPWQGELVELRFDDKEKNGGILGGFYERESWGAWSSIAEPWVIVPFELFGRCKIAIEATSYGANIGAVIQVAIAGQLFPLVLTNNFNIVEFELDIRAATNFIRFKGLDSSSIPEAPDPRTMGIGLRRISIERIEGVGGGEVPAECNETKAPLALTLDGVVYTSVFDPADDRKNWPEIMSAFCYTFRDDSRATLLLNMASPFLGAALGDFHCLMQRIGPINCRVIILYGYLSNADYRRLIECTTYYVNASHCEDAPAPLIEFMAHGVPVLAPDHTAMRDYISESNALIVQSGLEPVGWRHDSRNLIRACRYRIDWSSLAYAYRESFRVAMNDAEKYQEMSAQAQKSTQQFCAESVVAKKIEQFFCCDEA